MELPDESKKVNRLNIKYGPVHYYLYYTNHVDKDGNEFLTQHLVYLSKNTIPGTQWAPEDQTIYQIHFLDKTTKTQLQHKNGAENVTEVSTFPDTLYEYNEDLLTNSQGDTNTKSDESIEERIKKIETRLTNIENNINQRGEQKQSATAKNPRISPKADAFANKRFLHK